MPISGQFGQCSFLRDRVSLLRTERGRPRELRRAGALCDSSRDVASLLAEDPRLGGRARGGGAQPARSAARRSRSVLMWASESAFMVGLAVVAFRDGGVGAVGVVTGARMAAAALLAPFLATVADRVRRERVLACVGLVRAATLGAAAVVRPPAARRRRRTASPSSPRSRRRCTGRRTRPCCPALCTSPQQLTSANAVRGMLDSSGDARRPGRRGGPAGGERTGRRLRGVRRRVAARPVCSSSRFRMTRRRAPRRPAAAVARCSGDSPPSRPIAGLR